MTVMAKFCNCMHIHIESVTIQMSSLIIKLTARLATMSDVKYYVFTTNPL